MEHKNSGIINSIPLVTRNLIIINLLFWLADTLLPGLNMTRYLGLHYFKSDFFMPHQLITYMFMHGGFSHIFFNMFAVFMFGRTLEMVWGPKRFLSYYILTGIGAGLAQLLVTYLRLHFLEADISADLLAKIYTEGASIWAEGKNYSDPILGNINALINVPTVGASGAVFGILLAFGMLFPNAELIMIPIPIPIKAKWFVIGYGAFELFLGVSNNPTDNIAHFAHFGGLLTGLIIILFWKRKNKQHGNLY